MFYPNISEQNEAIKNKENKFVDIAYKKSEYKAQYFLVYSNSKNFSEIEMYAKTKPWSEKENTSVFFINNPQNIPSKTELEGGLGFSEICLKRKKSCIAIYSKISNGNELFEKYPYIDF
jgi:hypothetical protein